MSNPAVYVKFFNDAGEEIHPYDIGNNALRVNAIAGGISIPNYDFAQLTQDPTHDVWTFKTGGAAGTLVATVTITYTDATKVTISTVART